MFKLLGLLVTVAVIQSVRCETRDQRHVQMKLDTINEYLTKAATVTNKLESNEHDTKEALYSANDFYRDIKESLVHLNLAIIDNARNNQQGKQFYEIAHHGKELVSWTQNTLLGDATKLPGNIKLAVEKYTKLIKEVADAFPHLKNSTENTERAVNSLLDFLDNSLFLVKKLFYHIEFKQYSNADLRKNINEVLEQDLASLEEITPGSYRVNELIQHGRQLHYFLRQIIERLYTWTSQVQSNPNQFELKATAENTINQLREILAGIERHASQRSSLENLKIMYKLWLRGFTNSIFNLDVLPKGQPEDIVRAALFDTMGVTMNYKTIFANLAGSKN